MKITFITYIYPYPERGFNPGIERVIEGLSLTLANNGHDVTVITTYRNGGILKEEKYCNIKICRVNDLRNIFGRVGSLFSLDLLSINYFIKEYRHILIKSDIIHVFTPFLINIPGVPIVSHFHHEEKIRYLIEYLYIPISKFLWKGTYKRSNIIISVSKYSEKYLINLGISQTNIFVIPNGIDIKKFHRMRVDELTKRFKNKNVRNVLLYVGPLTKRKGLKYLIGALPKVLREYNDTILIFVGGGDIKYLKKLAKEIGVNNNVMFEGFIPDEILPMYYNVCDIFVFPSLQEGFGIVLLEAMACGKSVIASNTSAIPEVVGDAGILVEPKNSDKMADAIIDLLKNKEKKEELEKRALMRAESFTWDKIAEKLINIYKQL